MDNAESILLNQAVATPQKCDSFSNLIHSNFASEPEIEPVIEPLIEPVIEAVVENDLGLKSEQESIGNYEESGLDDGGGGGEVMQVVESDSGVVSGCGLVQGRGSCEISGSIDGGGGVMEVAGGDSVVVSGICLVQGRGSCEISGLVDGGGGVMEVGRSDSVVVSGCGLVQGRGSCEISGSVDGGVVEVRSDSVGVSGGCLVEDCGTVVGMGLQGGEKRVSDGIGGAGVVVEESLLVIDTAEDVEGELDESIVIEKNVNNEIVEMDGRVDGGVGNVESVVDELDDPQSGSGEVTAGDCDDTVNESVDGVIPVGKEKMEMDISTESNMRMGEGSKSEHASTSCDPIIENEGIVVAKAEKDQVKEDNLVDGSEKEEGNQAELLESSVAQYERAEVKGEVEKNDEFKDVMEGNSSFGDHKVDADKEVGMNVEECRDSKELDSESTVSESLADKSGKDDEVEGNEEGRAGDVRMEREANTDADSLDITKDEEPESTGDSDAPQTPRDEEMVPEEETDADTEVETGTDVTESGKAARGKRKRGKNKSPADPKSTPKARKTIEEDVCFICYDGGELVLCDRRGCPKAYHPYCVDQDEAFFVGKSRWNCGWHMCSVCDKKNAQYMCYTCPFSLCKGCIKDAVIFCVRGKKGFCETCMKFVKILESNAHGMKDIQAKLTDKGSWEYLFRDYFIELKSELSLSSAEIAEAKSPWKGLDTSGGKDDKPRSGIQNLDVEQESTEPQSDPKDDTQLDAPKPRRKNVKKRLKRRGKGQTSYGAAEAISDEDGPHNTDWASKELLEFVMHMKSGDRSILSEYDVQALLLEYIKRNNLRDPRQKSRIICDARLQSLFGKPRVGHFEMLKLLESHFTIKEDPHIVDVQGSVVDTNSEQLEVDGNADTLKGTKEKKRKSRKKGDRRGPQSNLDDYAAIDMHNISVIYLRRKLMEDLLEDSDTFQDKVAGTFVRIRISGSVQKQDIYRLVQVVGASNAAEPYKVGKKTTNIMVEILNLNKTEVISIDTISNQDFTEDECKRLRQSIKCGLINRLTVGDILDKATDLQTAKVNDWLETEVVRLSHLRDRASEKGRKKELRECVEKLQLLKTPKERQRRLDEIPEIHVDPKMDPTYESEEEDLDIDENRQDVHTKIRGSGSRGGRGQISPGSEILSKDPFSGGSRYLTKSWELDRNLSSKNLLNKGGDNTTHFREVQGETSWNQVRDRPESSNLHKLGSTVGPDTLGWNSHDAPKSESLSSSVSKPAPALTNAAESSKINESEKNWYYKDPSGKVQGPFSMIQLRKWNNTGYFPAELKVWRTNENEEDCIPLADVLSGKFLKESTAAASVLPSSLSANLTNIMASLEHAREQQDREKLRSDQGASGNLASHIVSPGGQAAPSVEHPKFSSERWSQSESSRLPSPTPILNNTGFTREGGSLSTATSYLGRSSALPSPNAASPEYQGPSSTPTSGLRSGETLRTSENEPVGPGLSGVQVGLMAVSSTQKSQALISNESRVMQVHGNVAVAHDSFSPQTISNQNPLTGIPGWGSGQSQIVDTNAVLPVQPQIQAYGQWGNIPAAGYTHPGNFPKGNQPNMQFPATPRPENPNQNFGWGVMQGNQNTGWVGAAPPTNANVNWGAALPGPPPVNQNMGWTMPAGNLGAAVQGQLPAVANSGWTTGTKNPPVPGLPPAGNLHQSYVTQTGIVPSNVHMPASASGWSPAPPVPGLVQGNTNQGLSMHPENQGPWGSDQNHLGGQFSNQRDQSSHGGDSSYSINRSRTRPPSFSNGGAGGPARHFPRQQLACPYNRTGRCIKGTACDYLHT